MDKMSDEELNEAIAVAHGWVKLPWPAIPTWQRPTQNGVELGFMKPPEYADNPAAVLELVEEAGFIVGPEWTGGFNCTRCGWSVYADWMSAAEDTWSFDSQKHVLAVAPTYARAVAEAWLAWKRGGA